MQRWRTYFLLLVFILLIVFGAQNVFADETGKSGDNITWTLDDAGTLTISGMGELCAGDWDISSIKKIVISEGVGSISRDTFYNCKNLTSIMMPSSLSGIGMDAFNGCESLTSITIPSNVEIIGSSAFSRCKSLTSITIPSGVHTIRDGTFDGCRSLTNITILGSVTSIEEYAFCECESLTSIMIPSSVTSIGEGTFKGCKSLTNITIPSGVTSIEEEVFSGCESLTSIMIPSSVTRIKDYAFCACNSLMSITIPNSVTGIGAGAFSYCKNLTGITIPSSVTSIGKQAFASCIGLTSIEIPSGVISIAEFTFYCCTNLTNITIPSSVTGIESNAFYSCTSLKSITIPSSVSHIGDYAFSRCDKLTDIYYNGSDEEWNKIIFGTGAIINNVTIHYNSTNGNGGSSSGDPNGSSSGGSTLADVGTEENSSNKDNNTNRGNELIIPRDVWGFDNFKHYHGCKIEGGGYKNPYIDKLDPASREAVLKYLKKGASSGHCFGMSAIVILNKIGRENIKHWGDVDCIRNFSESGAPLWMICYYNAMQKVLDYYYEVQNFSRKSRTEQVRILAEKVDKVKSGGTPVLLVYQKKGGGAHAVVAYALESGNFKSPTTGREFNRKVRLYDCNAIDWSEKDWSEKTCLLFRAGTGEWEIPRYGTDGGASFNGAELLCATNDVTVFDWKADIIEASLADTIENGTNYLDFSVITFTSNTNVILKRIGTNDQWEIDRNAEIVSGSSNIVSYSDIGSESNQNCGVNVILPSANGSYSFIPASGNPGKIDLGVLSSNHYVAVESDTAKELDFTIGESTILRGNKDDFQVTITSNNMVNEGQFETVSVTGNAEGDISISVDNGLITVEGDNIEGLTVKATDGEESTSTIIENSGKAVFSNLKKDSLSAITSQGENSWNGNGSIIGWTVQPNSESQTDENTQPAGEKQVDEVTQPATEAQPVTPETVQESITISRTPSSVKIKVKKNKVTVSWKKIKKKLLSKIKNIQIQYSTDPLFVQNTVKKTIGKNKTEVVLKLKKKTIYYIRLRYVGKDGFSNWSKVKKVKMK